MKLSKLLIVGLASSCLLTTTADAAGVNGKQRRIANKLYEQGKSIDVNLTTASGIKKITINKDGVQGASPLDFAELATATRARVVLPGVKDPKIKFNASNVSAPATKRAATTPPNVLLYNAGASNSLVLAYGVMPRPGSLAWMPALAWTETLHSSAPFYINLVVNCTTNFYSPDNTALVARKNFGPWTAIGGDTSKACTGATSDFGFFQIDFRYADQQQDGAPTSSKWVLSLPIF